MERMDTTSRRYVRRPQTVSVSGTSRAMHVISCDAMGTPDAKLQLEVASTA